MPLESIQRLLESALLGNLATLGGSVSAAGRSQLAAADVSRETTCSLPLKCKMTVDPANTSSIIVHDSELERRFAIYVELLDKWKGATNLISESGFANVWKRHIADSAQLLDYAPDARRWIDLGSGAGFPGMVIAIQLADCPEAIVHCVESNKRKAAFLREVARATGAPTLVHVDRIESINANSLMPVDAVTARGLAPLRRLIEFANVWLRSGAIGIFPRGRSAQDLVAGSIQGLHVEIQTYPNKIDPNSRIVRVRSAH